MIDLNKFVSTLARSGLVEHLTGGREDPTRLATTGRSAGKSLLKLGVLSSVGGLCWKALRAYQQKQQSDRLLPDYSIWATLGPERFIDLAEAEAPRAEKLLVFRAMVSAAMIDRNFDAQAQSKLFAMLGETLTSATDKASVFEELRHPLNVPALACEARDAATAIEVYAAALLAVERQTPATDAYLQGLAKALELPAGLVHGLHVGAQTERAVVHAA